MFDKITRPVGRMRKLADYAAELLEKIRKMNALELHFENQNATLFGTTEIMKRLNEFEKLRIELQKSNQLMNVTAAELAAFSDKNDKLHRQMGELERSLSDARAEIAQLGGSKAEPSSAES